MNVLIMVLWLVFKVFPLPVTNYSMSHIEVIPCDAHVELSVGTPEFNWECQ